MIQKNQNQSKMNLIDPDDAFQRDSVNKSAMSSFEVALAKNVKTAKAQGKSVEMIAEALKLSVNTINNLLAMELPGEKSRKDRSQEIENTTVTKKEASTEDTEKEEYLSEAEKAYAELHGKKKASTLQNLDQIVRNRIQPSRKGDWTETGGSNKMTKNHNSIWDSGVLERMAAEKDNGEKIREEKAAIANKKQLQKEADQRIDWDQFKESLGTSRDVGVSSTSAQEGYNYSNKVQKNGLSIFANLDGKENPFTALAEKTDGEMLKQQNVAQQTEKNKDRSWVKNESVKSSNTSFFDKMIDSMTEKE